MKYIELKDTNALVDAMGGKDLYGYTPAEKYKVSEWKFPVILEIDSDTKTFKLVDKIPEPEAQPQPAKKEKRDWVKTGFIIAAGIVAVVIVGIVIFKVF